MKTNFSQHLFTTVLAAIFMIVVVSCGNQSANNSNGSGSSGNQTTSNHPKTSQVGKSAHSAATNVALVKPNIKVYIENSGSMDGYVNGNSGFKNEIYKYLSDIYNLGNINQMSLYYINSQIIPQCQKVPDWQQISAFSKDLTVASFKKAGGKRTNTVFSDIFNKVIQNADKTTISVLISDLDPDENLSTLRTSMKNIFIKHLKQNPNLAVCIYKCSANFNGDFYLLNAKPTKTKINAQRPYYICLIGDKDQLCAIQKSASPTSQAVFTIMKGGQKCNYALIVGGGNYQLDRQSPKNTLYKLKKDRSGKVTIKVRADLSKLLLSDSYLKDPKHWVLSDPTYQILLSKPTNSNNTNYTYLTLQNNYVKKGTITAKLKMSIPSWVKQSSAADRLKPYVGKTYGLEYLIGGIYDAFSSNSSYYTDIKIIVK